jgi:predicted TPR repeat methyltransferase
VEALEDYEEAYLQYLAEDPSDDTNLLAVYRWMGGFAPLEGKRLLDVGAGSGKLVRFLRARGVDAQGIEPSSALFDRFLSSDTAFTCAKLDEFHSSLGRTFDIVTAFDVIEHVLDPGGFLNAVSTALEPGGMFFVSTPNVESLAAKVFGRRWHFYYPYHLSYFGPRTLSRAAACQRLRLVDCRHYGRIRSVGYIIRYGAEFVCGARAPAWARWFDDWYLSVNLFDTMYVVFKHDRGHVLKTEVAGLEPSS